MQKYLTIFIIVCGFIILDIITGLISAAYNGNFNSSVMRKGGLRKITELLTIIVGYFIEFACKYIDLGIDLPVASVFCIYICIMEFISIIENLANSNPELNALFKPYLEKLKRGFDDEKRD